jgi:hypothetical protein
MVRFSVHGIASSLRKGGTSTMSQRVARPRAATRLSGEPGDLDRRSNFPKEHAPLTFNLFSRREKNERKEMIVFLFSFTNLKRERVKT